MLSRKEGVKVTQAGPYALPPYFREVSGLDPTSDEIDGVGSNTTADCFHLDHGPLPPCADAAPGPAPVVENISHTSYNDLSFTTD